MHHINLATRPSCTCSLRFWSGKRENDPYSQKCSILIRARLLERFLLFLSFRADINILNRTYMYNFLGYLKDRPAIVDVSSTYMNALDSPEQVHWTMGRASRRIISGRAVFSQTQVVNHILIQRSFYYN